MRSLFLASLLAACGSSSSGGIPTPDAGDASTEDARVTSDADVPPSRPALSALRAEAKCSSLRASPSGMHFLCWVDGKPHTDFGGAALPTAPLSSRTLIFAGLDGKTKWSVPTCAGTEWHAMDGLPSGEAMFVATISKPCTIGTTTLQSAGEFDGLVARFDANGVPQWVKRFGGTSYERAESVRLDKDGNAIITGKLGDALDATSLPIATGTDQFIAKLSPAGDVLWTKTFTRSYGHEVSFDAEGNIYVLADLLDGADFGGGPVATTGKDDQVVVKLRADGSFVWQRPIHLTPIAGATDTFLPSTIGVMADGLGGAWFSIGYAGYDAAFSQVTLPSKGNQNTVLVGHLDALGEAIGGEVLEGDYGTSRAHLAQGPAGTLLFATNDQDASKALLARFGVDGHSAWKANIGTRTDATGLGFDGASILLMGEFSGTVALGPASFTGTDHTFLARFAQ